MTIVPCRRPGTVSGHRWIFFVIACSLYFIGRAPFIGQWDSFDYLKQTVTHHLSDLGFGRPVFIAYNVLLWESAKRIFRLSPLQVESVAMAAAILLGGIGVLVFRRLARQLLPTLSAQMATLALLLSPMYAVYSGYIMTEVPMLVTAVASASILWATDARYRNVRTLAGGMMFGLAVGIREQALVLGPALLWILWVRRPDRRSRLQASVRFGFGALIVISAPILALYLQDPGGFVQRTRIWWQSIPKGEMHFWRNVQASLLFALAACPAAWLALFGAGLYRIYCGAAHRSPPDADKLAPPGGNPAGKDAGCSLPCLLCGVLCSIVLPLASLWRNADVQIHPRYAMVALPGAVICCASIYHHWFSSKRAAVAWALMQMLVFGTFQVGFQPIRAMQREKKEYVNLIRESITGGGLLIAGGYSPILDYYRALGERPRWRVLWSGWGWDRKMAENTIGETWIQQEPVYLCEGPFGWLYFEDELLDLHFIFKDCRREVIVPGITRLHPRSLVPPHFGGR